MPSDAPASADQRVAAQPDVPVSPQMRRAAFIFVFVTILLDMLALGIIIPVLPKLVVDFAGGDVALLTPEPPVRRTAAVRAPSGENPTLGCRGKYSRP